MIVPQVNLTARSSERKKGGNRIIESEDNEEYHRTTTAKASQADLAVCHGGIVSDEGNASEVPMRQHCWHITDISQCLAG
jgi:hypothetical protein